MSKKMLIDATHAEETRVAVVDGSRLVDFDYESKVRKQLKGSIFLAKVTRVEPSLQAAFVNFGGNRHGFLPFSEIHPDYFRIPIADREALLADQQREMQEREAEEDAADAAEASGGPANGAPAASPSDTSAPADAALGGEQDEDDAGAPPTGHIEEIEDEDDEVEEIGGEDIVAPLEDDEEHARELKEAAAPLKAGRAEKRAPRFAETAAEDSASDGEAAGNISPAAEAEFIGEEGGEESRADQDEDASHDDIGHDDNDDDGEDDHHDDAPHDENGVDGQPAIANAEGEISGEINGEGQSEGERGRGNSRGRGRGRSRHGGGGRSGGRHGSSRQGGGRYGGGSDRGDRSHDHSRGGHDSQRVEMVGGDGIEGDHPVRPTMRRHYKIQEVIKRGQIMLIQVSKEERGNKGAAVSTYLSLPGRYCVLMPNSTRAGGVSRKIANYEERSRMREILAELQVPDGMSVIMRTAGMSRTKPEIKRDLDYLMKLWDSIRELTLQSTAPALIHEEGNLIRRSIRDIYGRDVDEIHVAGADGYTLARDFMKMMIPSHVKRVIPYADGQTPLFNRFGVEGQISSMSESTVQLKSGGYLVINPTEALVSVDVNSGRATKERHIEETAVKTNLEAAEEVARQLRLRDLGGLVVIDFIDMEDRRNNRRVEEKLKQALSGDRARIQIGRISSFGLLEMSRQRLNPSLTEAQFEKCAQCQGSGVVRTTDSATITALRALEDEGAKGRAQEVTLKISNDVALYILNNKRAMLNAIEERYGLRVQIQVETHELPPSGFLIDVTQGTNGAPRPVCAKSRTPPTASRMMARMRNWTKPMTARRRKAAAITAAASRRAAPPAVKQSGKAPPATAVRAAAGAVAAAVGVPAKGVRTARPPKPRGAAPPRMTRTRRMMAASAKRLSAKAMKGSPTRTTRAAIAQSAKAKACQAAMARRASAAGAAAVAAIALAAPANPVPRRKSREMAPPARRRIRSTMPACRWMRMTRSSRPRLIR